MTKIYKLLTRDPWLLAIILTASIVSVSVTVYYLSKGETLLYNDAYSHLIIARRITDSLTPGVDQLGGIWLPLQHVLMQPFIWNDTLWYTGLAGTIPSMLSYIIAAGYLFCLLRRLTQQTFIGLIGVIIFLCNPNILYLQSTPLTEVMCSTAFVATAYYLLCWLQEKTLLHSIYVAIAVCVATLIRYDGWLLFVVVSILIISAGIFRKYDHDTINDHIMVYLSIAPLGIIFWFLWNKSLYGDPLYFLHSEYSAQSQQLYFLHKGQLPTYHNILISLHVFTIDIGQTVGWELLIYASLSLVILLLVYRKRQECFLLVVMLVPYVFYILTLFQGSSIIQLPGAGNSTFFNVRYGAQMVLPVAFFAAWGNALLYSLIHQWYMRVAFIAICIICIGMQVADINASGILSLQDGLTGRSCIKPTNSIILSLSQHYNGNRILTDEFTSDINPQLFDAHFSDIIYEGSGSYWKDALAQPTRFVDWVALNPYKPDDIVSALLLHKNEQEFLSSFTLIASDSDGLQLYYRIGASPFPTRPIPNDLPGRSPTCGLDGQR